MLYQRLGFNNVAQVLHTAFHLRVTVHWGMRGRSDADIRLISASIFSPLLCKVFPRFYCLHRTFLDEFTV